MSAIVTVDFSQMDEVFARYVVLSRKSVAEALRHQVGNWCYRAAEKIHDSLASNIDELEGKCKLIAWLLSTDKFGNPKDKIAFNRYSTGTKTRKRKDGTTVTYHTYQGHKTDAGFRVGQQRQKARMGFYTREQARAFAPKHFQSRRRAIRFVRTFIKKIQQAVQARSNKVDGNQRISSAIQASLREKDSAGLLSIDASALYTFEHATSAGRKDNATGARRIERVVQLAFEASVSEIVPNMEQYIARKMDEAAQGARIR